MFGIGRWVQGSECLRGMGGELRAVEAVEYSNMRYVHNPHVLYAARSWIWMRDVDPASPLCSWESLAWLVYAVVIPNTSYSSFSNRSRRVTSSTQTPCPAPFAFSATCPVARRHPHLSKLHPFFPISASMTASLPNSSNPLTRLSCFQTGLFDPRPSSSGSWIFSR